SRPGRASAAEICGPAPCTTTPSWPASRSVSTPAAACDATAPPHLTTIRPLMGQPLAYERGGGEGEPGGSPSVSKKGAAWGKHGFPPRERAGGERRSCRGVLVRERQHLVEDAEALVELLARDRQRRDNRDHV